jgi:hypothetical protein
MKTLNDLVRDARRNRRLKKLSKQANRSVRAVLRHPAVHEIQKRSDQLFARVADQSRDLQKRFVKASKAGRKEFRRTLNTMQDNLKRMGVQGDFELHLKLGR